jgi:rhamnose transport system substrate-binding protein
MMPKSSGNAYFETGTRVGGEEAIKALGYELVYTASEKSEASQQIQIIDAAAAQKPKAIVISATDPKAICPPLKKAMAAGIKVVTYDADAAECRDAFALQANAEGIGRGQIQIICDLLGGAGTCEGEIAILSATATAPNQNEWIKWMNEELKDAKYGKLKLVATVYGDDLDQKSYDEALGLFKSYPNLKGIISPTSVGVVAAARAITDKGLIGKIMLTGLGVPSQLKEFVKSGACPKFALWNPIDLGYLAIFTADALLKGKGKEGDKFTAGRLGEYTFGKDGVVLLGPPFIFDKDNVDNFGF